jgi:hypothetical protein
MKKLLFVIFLGVLIYSCSEVNEPVNVNNNVEKITPAINTLQINKKVGTPSILADTVRKFTILIDSVMPPNGKIINADTCLSIPRGIKIQSDSVMPPNP